MEKYFVLRTQVSYSHHCDLIETAPELAEHYSTVYGINYCSPLDSLSNFEVAEGAMIPDIMHDILDGVLPLEMKNMLKVLIICDDYICRCKFTTRTIFL